MTDATANTLDLRPGDIVSHGVAGALKVSEIREPRHPAMPGLVIAGHYYVSGEMRWSDRESAINDADLSARWTVHKSEHFPLADERHAEGEGWAVFTYQGKLYVHQHMVRISPIIWAWPLAYQRADALARRYLPGARLDADTLYGVHVSEKWRRIYTA